MDSAVGAAGAEEEEGVGGGAGRGAGVGLRCGTGRGVINGFTGGAEELLVFSSLSPLSGAGAGGAGIIVVVIDGVRFVAGESMGAEGGKTGEEESMAGGFSIFNGATGASCGALRGMGG